ncbi:MAG: hypothetical protein Q9167_004185 [Letrouitia subvulpina]
MVKTRSQAAPGAPSKETDKKYSIFVTSNKQTSRKRKRKSLSAEDAPRTSPKKAKSRESSIALADTKSSGTQDNREVQNVLSRYGALPLHDVGLSDPAKPTPETILALVFHAMLTSARISHDLAYKSVKCLIEAGYHNLDMLSKSTWQERTEVLTRGGYTHYREKTATGLGELAEFVRDEYGKPILLSTERYRRLTANQTATSTTYTREPKIAQKFETS